MTKEFISEKEAICIITAFLMGSTLIVGIGGEAKNDAWIAGIIAILMAVPVILIYARLLALYPGQDLYEIITLTLGKWPGKLVAVLYIWYSFHLGALVIRNFGEFVNTVTMPETPMLVPMFCLGLVGVVAVKSGVEVIGRITAYLLPAIIFIIVVVQILIIPELNFRYLRPVLHQDLLLVLRGGFTTFSFPFAESVLLMGILFAIKTKVSPYRVYFSSLLFAGTIIMVLTLRNILVLGPMLGSLYFPSHVAVSRVNIGEFLQRIEVTVVFVFIFGAFIKSSVCLYVACKGIGKIFNLDNYRSIVIQVGLLMVYFAYIVYDSTMLMAYWAFKVYAYYAFPFQVILPLIIWVIAEIKSRRNHLLSG